MKNPSQKSLVIISAVTGALTVLYLTFNFALLKVLSRTVYSILAIIFILGFLFSVFLSVRDYLGNSGKKIPLSLIINIVFAVLIILSAWLPPIIIESVQYNSTKKVRQEVVDEYLKGNLELPVNKFADLPKKYKSASDLGKICVEKSNAGTMIIFLKSSNTSNSTIECYIYTKEKPDKNNKIGRNIEIKKDYKDNWYYGVYYWSGS